MLDNSPLIYPAVAGEFETIDKVLQGYSLGRYGDGELKILHGAGYAREPKNKHLTEELRASFFTPHERCLVGIPTMDPRGPKYQNWTRHAARFNALAVEGYEYVSAFVTRPDSAPWISCREYAEKVQSIWAGKRVAVLCEQSGSMVKTVSLAAKRVVHISCRRHRAYARIDQLESQILRSEPEVVILCAGPTASCLANRFSARGVHAVDMGSAGQFLWKLLTA
jgi:hypothetical protein